MLLKSRSMTTDLRTSLTHSIGTPELADELATIGDVALDGLITSGALDGVPILGSLIGVYKAQKDIRQSLYLQKVIRFLRGLAGTTAADRAAFTSRLNNSNKMEEFGETILLILDKIDDTTKPGIIGKIMAAHINGKINYSTAMRLASIVNRCYAADLEYLRTFKSGIQHPSEDIADALFSAGLLANGGIDGGGANQDIRPGGAIYHLNKYGRLLIEHAL